MDIDRLADYLREHAKISLHVQFDELTGIQSNVLASGNDAEDREAESWVLREVERGNVWAWAVVRVTATSNGFSGFDALGACSFKDEADFRATYFEDMKEEALADLARNILDSHNRSTAEIEAARLHVEKNKKD